MTAAAEYGPWLSASDVRTRFRFATGSMTILPEFTLTLADGRRFRFDWHRYLGPTFLGADGEPLARQPGERHPLWPAFTAWTRQGQRIDMDGRCIWDPEPARPPPGIAIAVPHRVEFGWERPL